MRSQRVNLATRFAALDQVRKPNTDIGRWVSAGLKRVLAILEIPELPLTERTERFEELGISRFYRGPDLVVKVRDSERTVRALGRPVHPALHLQNGTVPDGAPAPGRAEEEWEQDWENAQIEAEDTIVAIEALVVEAEGWVSALEAYEGLLYEGKGWTSDLEGDGAPADCVASEPADADSGRNCFTAVTVAIGEAIAAAVAYLGNSAVVNAALTAARNAVTVALAAFTAGTITVSGLATAAVGAITALLGTSTIGWLAAAGVAIVTAGIVYEVYTECLLPEAVPQEQAKGHMR